MLYHDKTRKNGLKGFGKDEVAGSNPAISSIALEHVVSMGPGVFFVACFTSVFRFHFWRNRDKNRDIG